MKRLLCIFILAVMVLSLGACNQQSNVPTTMPTSFVPVPTGPVYNRDNYTTDLETLKAQYSTVIAELGDVTVDLEVLQIAYWTELVSFAYNNSGYLDMYNLDLSLPLQEQTNPGTGGTWQQYFLNEALNTLHKFLAGCHAAQLAGLTIPEDIEKGVDADLAEMEKVAKESGYEDMDAYVTYIYGPGCTVNALRTYNYLSMVAAYYVDYCISQFEITDQMVEDYYYAHEEDFVNAGMAMDDRIVYQVRHLLVMVDEGADDAAWEEARVKAQGYLDQYLAGQQTEDDFSELAADYSDDNETYASGGMVSGLVPLSSYPTAFREWYLAEGREHGDVELIKTELGYHVMYYVGILPAWRYETTQSMTNSMISAIIPDAVAAHPITVYYDKLLVAEATDND